MFTKSITVQKHIAIGVMVIAMFFGTMLSVAKAEAQSAGDLQATISALKDKLIALQAARTDHSKNSVVSGVPPAFPCEVFQRGISIGQRDPDTGRWDVAYLQKYLMSTGHYTYGTTTGYYGPATAEAVKRWQSDRGIVNNGTPTTTGYGNVGPATRVAMWQQCLANKAQTSSASGENTANTEGSSTAKSFGLGDVLSVTKKHVDPNPKMFGDDYNVFTITLKNNAGIRTVNDCRFCSSDEYKKRFQAAGYTGDVMELLKLVGTSVTATCKNAGTSYPEGTKRTSITLADGTNKTITDASFVCRSGEWKIEGSLPGVPTPTPSTSCLSGGTSYPEGTKRTSITLADGTNKTIADAYFVCRSGEWKIESGNTTNNPTFTATVSGLVATLKFTLSNGCAGYTITWGDGTQSTRTAASAGTMCTQALVNITQEHIYAKAGSYTVTVKRITGTNQTDTSSKNITVGTVTSASGMFNNRDGLVQGAATTNVDETIKEIIATVEAMIADLE